MADTASAEDDNHPRAQPWAEVALHATLRGLQIVLGLTVIGLYGSGLASQIKPAGYDQPKWAYAVVVATFSTLTASVYVIPRLKRWIFWIWDSVLFVFWIAVLAVFSRIYIDSSASDTSGESQLKRAVLIDMMNMILWLVTALCGAVLNFHFIVEWLRQL